MAVAIDTTSPGFVVSVLTNTREIRLAASKEPGRLGQLVREGMRDLTDRILTFTYEDDEVGHDVLKLRVDNQDLLFFDHPAWVKGNLVKFLFGYPGRIFGPRFAVVDNKRGFRDLTVTCVAESALANRVKCKLWKGKTRAQIVQDLVAQGSFPGVKRARVDVTNLNGEKPGEYQQARQTDWQFLQRLAEKVGYEVFVEGEVLYFQRRKMSRPPSRRFEYFWGNGDLVKFDLTENRAADRPATVDVVGRDPVSRKTVSATGSNSDTSRDTLGGQGTVVLTRSESGDLLRGRKVVTTPDPSQVAAKQEADTHYRRQEEGEVQATATIIGDPLLAAKSVVEIVGISDTLSGKYYVKKHVHVITADRGYAGHLTLIKNALSSTPSSNPPTLDKARAKENTSSPPSDPRNVVVRDPKTGELFQRRVR